MNVSLENPWLQLKINAYPASWSVAGRLPNSPRLENIRLAAVYRAGRRTFHDLDFFRSPQTQESLANHPAHGLMRQLEIHSGRPSDPLRYTLTFALPSSYPILLWKISAHNQSPAAVQLARFDLFSAGFIFKDRSTPAGRILFAPQLSPAIQPHSNKVNPFAEPAFFSNGWQSWSYCGTYGPRDRFKRSRLGPIRAQTDINAGTPAPYRRGLFASDMFGVLGDRRSRAGILLGFLSQQQNFGSLEAWPSPALSALRMWANGDDLQLDPGKTFTSDWACLSLIQLDEPDPLREYFSAVGREHGLSEEVWQQKTIPTGWCSWYQFYSDDFMGTVTAQDVQQNLQAVKDLRKQAPLDIVQIDDGFQTQIGDWFDYKATFPDGLEPLAAEINQAGHRAGLWLAPFIVHPKSNLAKDHPEWLLRNRLGLPVNAGYFWGALTHALDLTHPAAMDYAALVIQSMARDLGFRYLKLDFLFAAALPGKHKDPSLSRAQILRRGLQSLREAAGPDTFLLGCGCPLGPAIGLVDGMRIGADTSTHWYAEIPRWGSLFKSEPNFPAAKHAAHNAVTRAGMHRRWWLNDPDCLLLRPDTQLTLEEIQTAATVIGLSGGSLLLSDDLPKLPPERLRIALSLLPLTGRRPHVLDWFDQASPSRLQLDFTGPAGPWRLLAWINWSDQPQEMALDLQDFYVDLKQSYTGREFWSGEWLNFEIAQEATKPSPRKRLAAHGCALLALRPNWGRLPQYAGSDLHFSQGSEVISWQVTSENGLGRVRFTLERPGLANGHFWLRLPAAPQSALMGKSPLEWQAVGENLYRFACQFDQQAIVEIIY